MQQKSRRALGQYLDQEADRLRSAILQQAEARTVSPDQGDESDHATRMVSHTETTAVLGHLRERLEQVEAARQRFAENLYGICADCGQTIPPPRLEAVPYATLCVNCQGLRDRNVRSRRLRAFV